MVDYQDLSVEALVMDTAFQQWVLHPDKESNLFWTKWLLQHPEKEPLIDQAREIVLALPFNDNLSDDEVEEEWEKLQAKIISSAKINKMPLPEPRQRWWQEYQGIAAVFIGIALVVGILVITRYSKQVENIAYATSYEQTKTINLPDGSTVILNANSSVTFPGNWSQDEPREVWLRGEALFSIRHTRNHQRFIVHTGNKADIEVLGTQFNVYNRHQKVQVVLTQGQVQIAGLDQQHIPMQPGELVEWQAGKWRKQRVNTLLYTSWINQELHFEQTPLAEIAQKLQDQYGLQVSFENDALKALRFTGSLPTNNITECNHLLSKVFDVDITQNKKNLIIR
jgi:transmembrane sensor